MTVNPITPTTTKRSSETQIGFQTTFYFKPVGLFVEENQRPRQNISLQQGQQADEGTENQAVFHGEAEQVGFFAFQTDCRAGDGDGLRRNHFAGHAAGGVGSDGQLGYDVDLMRGAGLQRTEERVGGGVRTSQEYAQPAEERREEREHGAGGGEDECQCGRQA